VPASPLMGILVILFLATLITAVILACLLSRARAQVFAASREVHRLAARHKAAAAQASEAEEQAARLCHAVEAAVATARQAVESRDQMAVMGQQLGQLLACVTQPYDELPNGAGEHAQTGQWPTGSYR
jgi:FtsZ-interacting cell division protein ZipA